MKSYVMYCDSCKQETKHNIVEKYSAFMDMPIWARVLLAIISLGTTEFLNSSTVKNLYICQKCGAVANE